MKNELTDIWLKPLENLQPAETPAFLLTRIKQAVSAANYERVAPAKVVLAGLAFCLIILINSVVLLQNNEPLRKNEAATRSFDLLPDNDLYK